MVIGFFSDRSSDKEAQPKIDQWDSEEQQWQEGQAAAVVQAKDLNTEDSGETNAFLSSREFRTEYLCNTTAVKR